MTLYSKTLDTLTVHIYTTITFEQNFKESVRFSVWSWVTVTHRDT